MPTELSDYAGRLDYLAKQVDARRYLEIGVCKGSTFFKINLPFKVAVDPAFQFDTTRCGKAGELFFETTSDEFFKDLQNTDSSIYQAVAADFGGDPIIFDLIFIDGLHTFEQTLRDFENSLNFAHASTVWMFDDTIPSDEYSAIPDLETSFQQRKKTLLKGFPWHGDVFKVVPAIHDFFPEYSYCTLIEGNPQTIVWKAPARTGQPAFGSLEKIAAMNCADLAANIKLYLLSTADELPELFGKTIDPALTEQAHAQDRFRKIFKKTYPIPMQQFFWVFRFIPRWYRSIKKRLPLF